MNNEQYPKLSRFQIQKQQKPFHHSPQGPKKRKKLKHKEEVEVNFVPKKTKKPTKIIEIRNENNHSYRHSTQE